MTTPVKLTAQVIQAIKDLRAALNRYDAHVGDHELAAAAARGAAQRIAYDNKLIELRGDIFTKARALADMVQETKASEE